MICLKKLELKIFYNEMTPEELIEKIAESLGNTQAALNNMQKEVTSLSKEVKKLKGEIKESNELGQKFEKCLKNIVINTGTKPIE